MPAITGQGVEFQIGKEVVWGTGVTPTKQIEITKASFKLMQSRKQNPALVGRRGPGRMEIMSTFIAGDFTTIVKPDEIGLLLLMTFGAQASTAAQTNVAEVVEITTPSGLAGGEYFKLSTPSVKYTPYFKVGGVGSSPSVAGYTAVLVSVPTSCTAAQAATGLKTYLDALATFTATSTGSVVTVTAVTAGTSAEVPQDINSLVTFRRQVFGYGGTAAASSSYAHVFTPLAVSKTNSLPNFSVTIDEVQSCRQIISNKIRTLKFDAPIDDYLMATFTTTGREEVTDTAEALTVSARKPFKMKGGRITINGYLYAEVTGCTISIDNSMDEKNITWDGTGKTREIEPGVFLATVELDALFDADTDALRTDYFKTGDAVALVIRFESEETIETGYKYYLQIEVPNGDIIDDPFIGVDGPGRLKTHFKIQAAQVTGAEAMTVTLGDNQATDY